MLFSVITKHTPEPVPNDQMPHIHINCAGRNVLFQTLAHEYTIEPCLFCHGLPSAISAISTGRIIPSKPGSYH